jgi:hypothetical protein
MLTARMPMTRRFEPLTSPMNCEKPLANYLKVVVVLLLATTLYDQLKIEQNETETRL